MYCKMGTKPEDKTHKMELFENGKNTKNNRHGWIF